MRKQNFIFLVLSIILVMSGIKVARAEIALTDWLSVTGYFRYEVAVHTGAQNPNNTDQTSNNLLNFQRQYFQTEWTAKPSDCFKLVAKIRLMGDEAQSIDSALGSYKAFPVDVPKYDWTMLKMGSTNEFRAEVNELYTDLSFGDLWIRMGKQQIVWGEMIATRILDIINPLDLSRNLEFEPEEFDNIRIPEWAIRGRYQFGKVGPIGDLNLEGFVNPGDVQPTQYAVFGSPFNAGTNIENFPSFFQVTDKNRRGDVEYGFRLGAMIKDVNLTLNYMSLYNSEFLFKSKGIAPDPIHGIPLFAPYDWTLYDLLFDERYPHTNVFGVTSDYFIAPLNTVVTFEGTWIPDQPYQDAAAFHSPQQIEAIKDQGTWNYAIRLDRSTFVFPHPADAMLIQLQFGQTVREGNNDNILGADNSRLHKAESTITCNLTQNFFHDTFSVGILNVYEFSSAEYFKPSLAYAWGDHWRFDLYTVYCGGGDKRPGFFGGFAWVNETVARVTFQF